MDNNSFVYKQIFDGCLEAKVPDGVAADYAALGLSDYKKGRYFGKPTALIKDKIKEAKKIAKKAAKK